MDFDEGVEGFGRDEQRPIELTAKVIKAFLCNLLAVKGCLWLKVDNKFGEIAVAEEEASVTFEFQCWHDDERIFHDVNNNLRKDKVRGRVGLLKDEDVTFRTAH